MADACYFMAALLFILGLKRMSSPRTARGGIVWAGLGMLLAVVATLWLPDLHHRGLTLLAVLIGMAVAWRSGRRVAMSAMPQMVALYNGMGGGAAAAIGASELVGHAKDLTVLIVTGNLFPLVPERGLPWSGTTATPLSSVALALGILGSLIGSVSFTGSLIAFAKLQGWLDRRFVFPGQQAVNLLVLAAAVAAGVVMATVPFIVVWVGVFFVLALLFGVLMTLPIGGRICRW